MDSQPEHHQTLLDRVRERVSRWSAAWDGVAPEDKRRAGICIGLSATTILLVGLGVFHFEERKYDRLVAELPGVDLPATLIFDYPTLESIGGFIASQDKPGAAAPAATTARH